MECLRRATSMISRYRGDPNYAAETQLSALDGRVVDVLYTATRVGAAGQPGMFWKQVTSRSTKRPMRSRRL